MLRCLFLNWYRFYEITSLTFCHPQIIWVAPKVAVKPGCTVHMVFKENNWSCTHIYWFFFQCKLTCCKSLLSSKPKRCFSMLLYFLRLKVKMLVGLGETYIALCPGPIILCLYFYTFQVQILNLWVVINWLMKVSSLNRFLILPNIQIS